MGKGTEVETGGAKAQTVYIQQLEKAQVVTFKEDGRSQNHALNRRHMVTNPPSDSRTVLITYHRHRWLVLLA